MHELAICQALMDQIESIAQERSAASVSLVLVGVGPLSGVEPPLLKHAYPLVVAGTVAEDAILEIESLPVRVHCQTCGKDSDVQPNRLICGECGDWKTQLLSGDELLLIRLELEQTKRSEPCVTPVDVM